MKDELVIYRILAALTLVLIFMLIFLVRPIGLFNEAMCALLLIVLLIVDVKIILQVRKIKRKDE